MRKRKLWFYGSLIVLLITIILLTISPSLLTIALDKDNSIPLGTFITWGGIISFPLSIYWGTKELRNPTRFFYKCLGVSLKLLLTLAILWVPVSYLLAGNISFTFTEKETFQGGQLAMKLFWYLTYGIAGATILILITYWIHRILVKKKKNETQNR